MYKVGTYEFFMFLSEFLSDYESDDDEWNEQIRQMRRDYMILARDELRGDIEDKMTQLQALEELIRMDQ